MKIKRNQHRGNANCDCDASDSSSTAAQQRRASSHSKPNMPSKAGSVQTKCLQRVKRCQRERAKELRTQTHRHAGKQTATSAATATATRERKRKLTHTQIVTHWRAHKRSKQQTHSNAQQRRQQSCSSFGSRLCQRREASAQWSLVK